MGKRIRVTATSPATAIVAEAAEVNARATIERLAAEARLALEAARLQPLPRTSPSPEPPFGTTTDHVVAAPLRVLPPLPPVTRRASLPTPSSSESSSPRASRPTSSGSLGGPVSRGPVIVPSSSSGKEKATANPAARALRIKTQPPPQPLTRCERVRNIFVSLKFCFFFLVSSALVIVSVLSWNLTYQAAQRSIALVTSDYSSVLVTQISSDVERRLAAAEHTTALNKMYFATGVLSNTNSSTDMHLTQMMTTWRLQMVELVKDTVSSMTITSATTKGLYGNGWYFPPSEDAYMVQWITVGTRMTERHINSVTGELGDITVDEPDNDSTTSAWYQCVNISDPTSNGWTQPYLFYGSWFVSTSRTLLSPNGTLIGVVTADMQLGFIDTIAKDLADTSSVGTQFFILNTVTGALLGTSITDFDLTDDSGNSVYLYSDSSPTVLQAINAFIFKESGNTNLTTAYVGLGNFSGQLTVSGARLLVTVRTFTHITNSGNDVEWLFIHVLDRSSIESEIAASNKKVIISVVCICIAFIFATSAILWWSLRLVSQLSVILTSFARFEFRAHVKDGQLKSQSVFAELKEMQAAVLEMTRSFKRHLDGQREFFGKHSSDSSAAMNRSQPGISQAASTLASGMGGSVGLPLMSPNTSQIATPGTSQGLASPRPLPKHVNPSPSRSNLQLARMTSASNTGIQRSSAGSPTSGFTTILVPSSSQPLTPNTAPPTSTPSIRSASLPRS